MLPPQRGSYTLPAGTRSLVPTETLRSADTSTPRQPSIEEHGQPHNYTEQYSGYPAWALLPREVTVGGADSTRNILGHRLIHRITADSPTQLVGNTGLAF